mmetsp:Transcript_114485/g.328938  ORF Transcript_114485/g.328938 Transcript_114485/m.328938 type:complete len:218 (+) Transcript_114485:465-1118(+)
MHLHELVPIALAERVHGRSCHRDEPLPLVRLLLCQTGAGGRGRAQLLQLLQVLLHRDEDLLDNLAADIARDGPLALDRCEHISEPGGLALQGEDEDRMRRPAPAGRYDDVRGLPHLRVEVLEVVALHRGEPGVQNHDCAGGRRTDFAPLFAACAGRAHKRAVVAPVVRLCDPHRILLVRCLADCDVCREGPKRKDGLILLRGHVVNEGRDFHHQRYG